MIAHAFFSLGIIVAVTMSTIALILDKPGAMLFMLWAILFAVMRNGDTK